MRWTARLMVFAMATATACSLATSFNGLSGGDDSSISSSPDGSPSSTDGASADEASADEASTGSSGGPADEGGTGVADDASADAAPDTGTEGPSDAAAESESDAGTTPSDAGTDGRVPYPTTVLSDGPEGYWRLSETSGSTFADSSGNGHTATLSTGTVTYGRQGALAHDDDGAIAITGGLSLGDVFDFAGKVPFTIEAWVKPRLSTSGSMAIFAKMASPKPSAGTYLFIDQSYSSLGFERWANGGAVSVLKVSMKLPTTSFTHLVVTFDSTTALLYVDGVQRDSNVHGPGVADNAVPARWGDVFDGTFDELAIYSKALSAARVKAHYDAAQ